MTDTIEKIDEFDLKAYGDCLKRLEFALQSMKRAQDNLQVAQTAAIEANAIVRHQSALLKAKYRLDDKERVILPDGSIGPAPEAKEGANGPA